MPLHAHHFQGQVGSSCMLRYKYFTHVLSKKLSPSVPKYLDIGPWGRSLRHSEHRWYLGSFVIFQIIQIAPSMSRKAWPSIFTPPGI